MKVREAIKVIERDGWMLVRQRGSHRQYKHPIKPGLVTIPGNLLQFTGGTNPSLTKLDPSG